MILGMPSFSCNWHGGQIGPLFVTINSSSCRLIYSRINCRLPQTPRTPTATAAHYAGFYFDEVWGKSIKPPVRRSSTSRSIGNSNNDSVNGDIHDPSVVDSVADTGDRERRRSEANQHVANYVNEQLERVRSDGSVGAYEDEFEAQLDGK